MNSCKYRLLPEPTSPPASSPHLQWYFFMRFSPILNSKSHFNYYNKKKTQKQLDIVTPYQLYFNPELIFKNFQVIQNSGLSKIDKNEKFQFNFYQRYGD